MTTPGRSNPSTGRGTIGGVPYTFRTLDSDRPPTRRPDVYRVETWLNETAPATIVRYVPGRALDAFFTRWNKPNEIVMDIRPLTQAEAAREIRAPRAMGEKVGA